MPDPKTSSAVATVQPAGVVNLGAYPRDRYNVLVPATSLVQTNPYLKPVLREVQLDADPNNGDVYPITQKKQGDSWVASELGLSAVAIAKLASAGGVVDIPQASGRVDDGRDPGVCTYRATIAQRMPDGEWRVVSRECTVKLVTLEKEIRDQKEKKGRENTNWKTRQAEPWPKERVEAEIRKELLLKEKFLERLAETGAKTRAARAAFGLKTKYSPAEINRPFVFAAVVPDYSNDALRERMLDQATVSIGMAYGPIGGSAPAAPRQLSAGPDESAIVAGDHQGPSELNPDELGAVLGAGGSSDVVEGQSREAGNDEPDWFGATTTKPAADEPAADEPATPKIVEVLRQKAETSGLQGEITDAQKPHVQAAFRGASGDDPIPFPVVAAGLKALWGVEQAPDGRLPLSAGQAQAIINASVDDDFRRMWVEAFGSAA